jgi:hypothetical protein
MEWTTENIRWFFQKPPPRQLDSSLLNDTLNVVFPKIIQVLFCILPVLIMVMVGIVLTFLLRTADIKGEWRLMNESAVISGKVLDIEKRKGSKGSITYVYTFEFKPAGHDSPVKGMCFSGDQVASVGQSVSIEYLPDTPRVSRIKGCRLNFSPLEVMVAIPFLGVITAILPLGLLRYKKRSLQRLLTNGVLVMAIIERIKPGAKGSLVVEVKYVVDNTDVKSKTNTSGLKDVKEWLMSVQEAGQPVMILTDPTRPKTIFLLELLLHTKKGSLFGLGG